MPISLMHFSLDWETCYRKPLHIMEKHTMASCNSFTLQPSSSHWIPLKKHPKLVLPPSSSMSSIFQKLHLNHCQESTIFNHISRPFNHLQPIESHLNTQKLVINCCCPMVSMVSEKKILTSTSSYPPAATPRRHRTQRRTKDQAKRRCSGAASGGGGRERLRSSGMPWAVDRRIQKNGWVQPHRIHGAGIYLGKL